MLRLLFFKHGLYAAKYLKKMRIFGSMGEDCAWHCKKIPSEPELVFVGDNVHVSADVRFVTHDVISDMFNRCKKYKSYRHSFYKGKISIGDNVVIGVGSTLLYDTSIGSNVIVAAGAVVTRNIPIGEI